jgi:hypothetical protein
MRLSDGHFSNCVTFGRVLAAIAVVAGLVAMGCLSADKTSLAAEPVRADLRTSLAPLMDLDEGWNAPPREARSRCWWWWLNGNVTKEAITRDLEAMKAKGLGGANIVDAGGADQRENRQVPHGPDFASPEWRELFLHALREADRLGLELGFNIQSGWNLGGPKVQPEDAAKKLTFDTTDVDGGKRVELQLEMPRSVRGYYRDVAVFALPLPEGKETGEGAGAGTARLARIAKIDNFETKAYYKYPSSFTASDASHLLDVAPLKEGEQALALDGAVNVTSHVDAEGKLAWDAPAGRWRILRLGYTLAGATVSTHSEGWDGLAIDYLDPTAFQAYWQDVVKPLLDAAGPLVGKSLQFLHTDSWELGPVNWTPKFVEQFKARRGYDPTPYLPTLAGYVVGDCETSTRFLNDFRRTLGDLIAEGNYAEFSEHAHARGLGIHPESGGPHAAPVDSLQCLGISDIPMGEFWARSPTHRVRDFERLFVKQSSSAAHIYGRRYVLAESFTSIGPHWEEDPQSLKPVFDRVACEGLNLAMLHTFDCSPESMGVPGQAYFAGTHINPRVTWWKHADAFFAYLNRCQFLLQQGLPVSDVLYFYGENVPSFVRLKRDDPAGVAPDYEYDVINADALITRTAVKDGQIVLPDGVSYEVLALPNHNSYGLAVLRHVAKLVDAGARVVGIKPERPIGLSATPEEAKEFAELADRLWGTGGGKTIVTDSALRVLQAAGIAPDFQYDSQDGNVALDYFHRRTDKADFYFIANRGDGEIATEASFRITGRQPEIWNAVTGAVVDAESFAQDDGRTSVSLELPPSGSVFVVFRRPIERNARGSDLAVRQPMTPAVTIAGPWSVQFDPKWGGPEEAVAFPKLVDWSRHNNDAVKYYSGSATYRTTFELPEGAAGRMPGQRLLLDLGRVENLAEVSLNGTPLGVVWTEPFRVDVSAAVRPGLNELTIEVTNLWPNRLIGDSRLPRSERLTSTNITKFSRRSPLLPSGLLGPVVLLEPSAASATAISSAAGE